MSDSINLQQLRSAVDRLILKHGPTNPELLHDLKDLQTDLATASTAQKISPLKVTELALRAASIVKNLLDIFG